MSTICPYCFQEVPDLFYHCSGECHILELIIKKKKYEKAKAYRENEELKKQEKYEKEVDQRTFRNLYALAFPIRLK